MFSGIIETTGIITALKSEKNNLNITVSAPFTSELKIDQSVAHNGVCLTVVKKKKSEYTVTAIEETLLKTNLSSLKKGDSINLERCLKVGDRLDGHIVQGHVDQTAKCIEKKILKGSHIFRFQFSDPKKAIVVEKGSICINGVSLTVVDASKNNFSVAIIPYTFEHTTFKTLKKGDFVNIEFDILGKYIAKLSNVNK
ncbi:MAG TPA: riboflavin synthase [Bacteroidia bacterium]|nr:riboflavin synthase [Bacteroidia bacterium]